MKRVGLTLRAIVSLATLLTLAACGQAAQDSAAGSDEVLPAPSGPHKTGRMSFHWKDSGRDELETRAAGDKRELMVHLFYPADANASGARAPYVPDANAMLGPWNEDQVQRITAMRAFSIENAALPRGDAKYPVILFAPGGGMKALTYHALLEDLASHGWVVAALDPPYNARAVRFPDGRVLGDLPPSERGWPATRNRDEERRFYQERIVHWSHDLSFVMDQLAALAGQQGAFANRLDLQRGVGVLGHSRGGQAAGAVRLLDTRVRGGINLDGTAGEYAILPVKGTDASGTQPFLWIQKPLPPPPTDERLQRAGRTRAEYDAEIDRVLSGWRRQLGSVAGGAIHVQINRPEVAHIDFSDEPFWDGHMTTASRPGKLKTLAETRAWVRAFFDGTVRGDWTPLKQLVGEGNASGKELTVQLFGQMWP